MRKFLFQNLKISTKKFFFSVVHWVIFLVKYAINWLMFFIFNLYVLLILLLCRTGNLWKWTWLLMFLQISLQRHPHLPLIRLWLLWNAGEWLDAAPAGFLLNEDSWWVYLHELKCKNDCLVQMASLLEAALGPRCVRWQYACWTVQYRWVYVCRTVFCDWSVVS